MTPAQLAHHAGRMAVVTSSPYQVALFLRGHLDELPPSAMPLIFTNARDQYRHLVADLEVRHLPISRSPQLTREDVRAGLVLRRCLRDADVATVVTMSPKAGFVGQLVGRSLGIERRLHIFTGQVWESMAPGLRRFSVMAADKVIARAATNLAADSPSQAQNLMKTGIAPKRTTVQVPHPSGSIRGVDLDVFRPRPDMRPSLRKDLGIPPHAIAFVQLGRIGVAKGVRELAEAFGRLRARWRRGGVPREPLLFLVGEDEERLAAELCDDGLVVMPFANRPELILGAMDVLVSASHREGFGSTIIEAAACGLPALGTDIVGTRDAVVAGTTGWLVPRMSSTRLHDAMAHILHNGEEMRTYGEAALQRARREFSSEAVSQAWTNYLVAVHSGEL